MSGALVGVSTSRPRAAGGGAGSTLTDERDAALLERVDLVEKLLRRAEEIELRDADARPEPFHERTVRLEMAFGVDVHDADAVRLQLARDEQRAMAGERILLGAHDREGL
jgi:hypothetical protein